MLLDEILVIFFGLLAVVCVKLGADVLLRGHQVLFPPVQGIRKQ